MQRGALKRKLKFLFYASWAMAVKLPPYDGAALDADSLGTTFFVFGRL